MINDRNLEQNLEEKNDLSISINFDIKSTPSTVDCSINSEISDCSGEYESQVLFIESCQGSPKKKNTIKDFDDYHLLGKGSYAKVYLARNIYTNKNYALKIIDKFFLSKQNKEYEVHIEKFMLSNLDHTNIIKLHSTFQDNKKLYFILEFCKNKDLSDLIRSNGRLSLDTTKIFAAEIILALEYMHGKGFYHRDLKPENILLDENMHLKLCDFGTADVKGMFFHKDQMKFKKIEEKSVSEEVEDNNYLELIGTAEYVSPEVLSGGEVGPAVDLWALGCIIYTSLHGKTPFKDKTEFLIFNKILKNEFSIDKNLDEDAQDIINKLLILDPLKRIGSGGIDNDFKAIKSHPFFKKINWEKLNTAKSNSILIQNGIFPNSNHNSNLVSPLNLLCSNNNNFHRDYSIDKSKFNSVDEISPFKIKSLNTKYENNENVVFESLVQKKSPWFHYNTRLLRLRSNGTLEYYEPKGNIIKGTIFLTAKCKAVYVDKCEFHLMTINRRFIFKLNCKLLEIWVEKINLVISSLRL